MLDLDGSLVVCFNAPHRISTLNCETEGFLGYSKELLRGRSLQIFHGAMTDIPKLTTAIQNSSLKKSNTHKCRLYDINGICRNFLLTCSPFCGIGGAAVACKISIRVDNTTEFANLYHTEPILRKLTYNEKLSSDSAKINIF